jgi:hypothetical protein
MKHIISLIVLISFALLANAADNNNESKTASQANSNNIQHATIKGTIVDKYTGEKLAGVEITLIDSSIKVYSDLDGNFEINEAPTGAQAIMIYFISYQQVVENVYVNMTNSNAITLQMVALAQ